MIDDSPPGYGALAKSFHWLIVLLLVAQFTLAWTMPHISARTIPETLINLHFSVGVLIILVIVARLAWRLFRPVPLLLDDDRPWQRHLAQLVHLLFYLVLLVMPVLGWMSASGRGYSVSLFGLAEMPSLLPAKSPLAGKVGDVHNFIATWVLLPLVGLHVLAVLYHQFVRRDRTLSRMLPRLG